jgi:hypothetical protein
MPSFKLHLAIANQRLGKLAERFEDTIHQASEATAGTVKQLRIDYESLLVHAQREVCQCIASEEDVRIFNSQTALGLELDASRADERTAIEKFARSAHALLSEWLVLPRN